MRTFSSVVDLAVFFILYFTYDVKWFAAFIASEVVGWSIRAATARR